VASKNLTKARARVIMTSLLPNAAPRLRVCRQEKQMPGLVEQCHKHIEIAYLYTMDI
jgi:hypothetical protein